jgi:hypothetical protein
MRDSKRYLAAITLEIGLAGCHGTNRPSESEPLTGGGRSTSFSSWSGGYDDLEVYASLHPDGVAVLDKRIPIGRDMRTVFRSPMFNGSEFIGRPPERFKLDDRSSWFAGQLSKASGAFGSMLTAEKTGAMSLDHVTLKEYVEYWRSAGARIGMTVGGCVVWETEDGSGRCQACDPDTNVF